METESKPQTTRLAVLDENGSRLFVIPAEVKGFYSKWKKRLQSVLIVIFLMLPWIQFGGEQLVLVDILNRHFVFFGLSFFSHDIPLIFFLVMLFVLLLALVTALFGRVWCGWACPQTVFIERIYRSIEIWTEGNYIQRRRLHKEGRFLERLSKSGTKWLLYLIVSSLFAHSFVAYFTGSKVLLQMMKGTPSENLSYFYIVTAMTGILLFNFGWFREQFCLIVCPYGKFQSVLMDSHTVNVMYDEKRGEPRKNSGKVEKTLDHFLPKNQLSEKKGDCVSCQRCVQVCPTGIDIRQGVQMECIGCTACIDACDEIMTKVNKPKGLIRYKAMTDKPVRWLRPRILIYFAAIMGFSILFSIALYFHSNLRVEVTRAHDIPYTLRKIGEAKVIQNHFKVVLENSGKQKMSFYFATTGPEKIILPENPIVVNAGETKKIPMFVETYEKNLNKNGQGHFLLKVSTSSQTIEKTLSLLGPIPEASE